MNISRFCAPDMRQAIKLVRASLGPDAVIISNSKVTEGIEIIAAIDYDETLFHATHPEETHNQEDQQSEQAVTEEIEYIASEEAETKTNEVIISNSEYVIASEEQSNFDAEPAIDEVKKEIHELRDLLEKQLAHFAWGEMKQHQPVHTELLRRLKRLDLDSTLINKLTVTVSQPDDLAEGVSGDIEETWQQVLKELAGLLPVTEDDVINEGGVIALVGPTGVGKTTSLAKLAARYVLRYGQRHVALVTTDCYRIGAHDQLTTFGRILGIPVQVASGSEELSTILHGLSDKRLVLVDTAGMSQRDMRLHDQLASLIDSGILIRPLLVLSATAQRSVLEETISAFSCTTLAGAIITKVDETTSLGGVLSVLIEKHLPLAFVADGQRVPEDMHLGRANKLVQRADELSTTREYPEDSAMAEQYGEAAVNAVI
ncbi:MAG: flagellar biosynthesis protein FlhF [Gammaproteobacteria bacterium]